MWWWSLFSFVKNICGFVEDDRLSSLSDDLLHKILSYVDTKDAIKTSGLSSRWRYIWTSMPYLNFNFDPSNTSKFVHDVLSHRDKLTGLHSLNLRCCPFDSAFAETVLSYALCNHVQELTLECLRITLPDSLIISRCLKHLTLLGSMSIRLETPWELPALTTLHLEYITFCNDKRVDLFSKCVNLKDLTLEYPRTSKGFRIWHPCLSSLTIKSGSPSHFKDDDDDDGSLQFSVESLDSLEKFDLCILSPPLAAARKVFGLLQHLHRVKFLTLNLEVVELVSSYMKERSSPSSSPFASLKHVKIYPTFASKVHPLPPSNVSTEMKNYFLEASPCASYTFISREEAMAMNMLPMLIALSPEFPPFQVATILDN